MLIVGIVEALIIIGRHPPCQRANSATGGTGNSSHVFANINLKVVGCRQFPLSGALKAMLNGNHCR